MIKDCLVLELDKGLLEAEVHHCNGILIAQGSIKREIEIARGPSIKEVAHIAFASYSEYIERSVSKVINGAKFYPIDWVTSESSA